MNTISPALVKEAEKYVTGFLTENLPEGITFHTLDHTKYVVQQTLKIGEESGLNQDELMMAALCAWFHDIGYAIDPENHERYGADKASEFLSARNADRETIEAVTDCILSTHMPQQPKKLLCKVVCDADLAHLAETDYFNRVEKMRKEWANLADGNFSKKKFYTISVKFFKLHEYHTDYGKNILQPLKDKNFDLLKKEVIEMEHKDKPNILKKDGKKKDKGYSRGVESMFRLTARNQINLSSIADNKSNILITVNALIISITMTILVTRFEETPNIILPTCIFLAFCLTTIIFAILSTRPNVSKGIFTREDIEKNNVNLLFFGNFYNMSLEEYEWAIQELMHNDKNLYATMIKDQYSLGKVLAKLAYYSQIPLDEKMEKGTTDSFFSGHVSWTAGASFFMAKVYSDYHSELGGKKWWLYLAALIPPAFVGYHRIRGLKHFPTDVMTGMAIGMAVGILNPHFHKIGKRNNTLSVVPMGGNYMGLSCRLRF